MASFFVSPPFVSHPITKSNNNLFSSSQTPPQNQPSQSQTNGNLSSSTPNNGMGQRPIKRITTSKTTAESTGWIASSLTRRFGIGAGLAWVGFRAVGVVYEQIKTRFEVSQEANASHTYCSSGNLPIRAWPWSSPRSPSCQHNYYFNFHKTRTQRPAPIFTYLHEQEQEDFSSPSTITATGWTKFSENLSGEWDGFGADFTLEGKPIELPESVVPDAYREWEVKVFDWQTQCPTLARLYDDDDDDDDDHNSPSLFYKTIKLLPTVGCEADAATRYTVLERNITTTSHKEDYKAFAYESGGCYVALWPVANNQNLELEHCLIDPRNKESRVRIIQVLELQESQLKLQSIKVFVEQWYGPFRNGDQLGGCALRDSAFAATQTLNASQVAGVWQGLHAVANFHTCQNMVQQLGNECIRKSIRDEVHLILLPKQLWCSVNRAENDETCCEVGWLLDKGRAITSKCTFSSKGELQEIAMANETAALV